MQIYAYPKQVDYTFLLEDTFQPRIGAGISLCYNKNPINVVPELSRIVTPASPGLKCQPTSISILNSFVNIVVKTLELQVMHPAEANAPKQVRHLNMNFRIYYLHQKDEK